MLSPQQKALLLYYIRDFRFFGIFLIILLIGVTTIVAQYQQQTRSNAAQNLDKQNINAKNINLTLTTIKPVPASSTTPEGIEVSSTLSNNFAFPISFQSGCGVAPILYAQSQKTGKTYKLLVSNTTTNNTNINTCITQENMVAAHNSQTLTFIYQLQGFNGDSGKVSTYAIANDTYNIEQGITYTIHISDKKNRYKKLEDRAMIDNFPTKRIRSNTTKYFISNSQNTTQNATVLAAQTSAQSITMFTLYNQDTGQAISGYNPLQNGAKIFLSQMPTTHLNIRAYTSPSIVGSVLFGLDSNQNYRIETIAPYYLAGKNGYWTPTVGQHTVKATPYNNKNAKGTKGASLTITFTVSNAPVISISPTPSPTVTLTPTPSPTLTPTPTPTLTPTPTVAYPPNSLVGPFSPKMLVIDYNSSPNPSDGSDALTSQLVTALNTAAKYHNSSFSSANFSIYQRFVENNPPPLVGTTRADYQAIFTKYDICTLAATQGVNFVWIWASGDSNNYAGTFLEWVTTGPTFYQTWGTNVPTCAGHTVVTFGLNYNRTVTEALHSSAHYMENALYYSFGPPSFTDVNATDMWDLFDGQAPRYGGYTGPLNTTTARCGNVHFPPNTMNGYDYHNTTTVLSACATYNPGNPLSQLYVPVNLTTWIQQYACDPSIQNNLFACQGQSYLTWWMQNFPGYNNTVTDLNHDPMPNWWQYILSIDSAVRYN